MIQLAVIDLAGTLVRDAGAVEGAFADALDAVAVTPDERMLDVVRATMGQSKIDVFRALLGDEQRARTANDAFEAAYERRIAAGETSALPGAVETLHLLRDGGLKVAVTTGFSAATRESLLHALGWTSLVDASLSPSGARFPHTGQRGSRASGSGGISDVPRAFAPLGAVEEDPRGEVRGKLLEPVFDAGPDVQHLARLEPLPPAVALEVPLPGDDDVHLVPLVRLLLVHLLGPVELDFQGAVAEQGHVRLPARLREGCHRVR